MCLRKHWLGYELIAYLTSYHSLPNCCFNSSISHGYTVFVLLQLPSGPIDVVLCLATFGAKLVLSICSSWAVCCLEDNIYHQIVCSAKRLLCLLIPTVEI